MFLKTIAMRNPRNSTIEVLAPGVVGANNVFTSRHPFVDQAHAAMTAIVMKDTHAVRLVSKEHQGMTSRRSNRTNVSHILDIMSETNGMPASPEELALLECDKILRCVRCARQSACLVDRPVGTFN